MEERLASPVWRRDLTSNSSTQERPGNSNMEEWVINSMIKSRAWLQTNKQIKCHYCSRKLIEFFWYRILLCFWLALCRAAALECIDPSASAIHVWHRSVCHHSWRYAIFNFTFFSIEKEQNRWTKIAKLLEFPQLGASQEPGVLSVMWGVLWGVTQGKMTWGLPGEP